MNVKGFSRVSKDSIISEIEKELKAKKPFFVTQHGTMSGTTMDKLRARLRKGGSRYLSVKKTLAKKAFEKADIKDISSKMDGACGIAFSGEDVVASSKVLVEFAKENEGFLLQAGYMNGQEMGVDKIKTLASLPSREVLLAKVAGGMQAPISKFVNVLSGTLRQVVNVLDAISKKKGSA